MRRRLLASLFVVASLGACADILGIDDGTPRTYDGSIVDSSPPETTTIPDSGPGDVAADVPIDVPVSPMTCGKTTCNAITEACCRLGDPVDASTQSFTCIAASASCDGGLKVTCADNANCAAQGHAGEECCALVPDGGNISTGTACASKSACSGADMCEPGDDENCGPEAGCKPSVLTIVGFTICK